MGYEDTKAATLVPVAQKLLKIKERFRLGELSRRPRRTWLVGLAALGGLLYSALGMVMAASLSPADPVPGRRRLAAYLYLITFAISLVVLVAAVIALIRRRRQVRANH